MDLSDLKVFETVLRLGSISRAATQLCTAQSKVTTRIRVLEGKLGISLFERHARGVTPTPAAHFQNLPRMPELRHGMMVCRGALC